MRASEDAPDFRVVAQDSVDVGPADPDSFTGSVTRAEVLSEMRPSGMRGHVFSYGPGSRSNWHVHEGEQALVVVRGEGLMHWEGLEAVAEDATGRISQQACDRRRTAALWSHPWR